MGVDVGSRDDKLVSCVRNIRSTLLKLGNVSTGDEYDCIIVQGSGTFGVESVLTSHFGQLPVEGNANTRRPLVCANGVYGRRIAEILRRLQLPTGFAMLEFEENTVVCPDQVGEVLAADPTITDVLCIHSETTTGVVNDIAAVGQAIQTVRDGGRDIAYTVDAMSSFGAYEVDVAELGIDFIVSSANKNIQGVPGFAFVIGKQALIQGCKGRSTSLSLDLHEQANALNSGLGQFRFTPPTHSLLAFNQALAELEEEGGVAARGRRYRENQTIVTEGLKSLGFKTYLQDSSIQGCIITTFMTPADPNWDFDKFYDILIEQGCCIYPGKLAQADSFRIGSIGDLYAADFEYLLGAIKHALNELGVENCGGPLVTAPSTKGVLTQLV